MPADDVRAAKAAYEADIFARANVVGVAIGNKSIRGRETDERCIVVFVEAKKPEGQLRHRDVVPKTFGSIRTDIVETGRFHALRSEQALDLERTKRIRPAPGGVSIGHVQITAGTLGVLARRNGRPVILSTTMSSRTRTPAGSVTRSCNPGPRTAVVCKTRSRASSISCRSSSRSGSPDRSPGSWRGCSGPSSAPRAG